MQLSIKDVFRNCDQILSFRQIWSHLLKKSLMENFIFFCSKSSLEWFFLEKESNETHILRMKK